MPDPPEGRIGYDWAVALALTKINTGDVDTRWSDAAGTGVAAHPLPSDPQWAGGTVYARRERPCTAGPGAVVGLDASAASRLVLLPPGLAGPAGWTGVGGVGLRRGRRDPDRLHTGDALDCWRVERLEDTDGEHLLRLRAEMKVPGRAWLELTVWPAADAGSRYRQRAVFLPRGLAGHLYWWAVAPFHGLVFGGMVRNITRAADGMPTPDPRLSSGASRVNLRKVAGRDCPVTPPMSVPHVAKIVSLTDAVAEFVHDGDTVALEGFTHLIPFAAGHEIIRQRRRDLTLARMTLDLVYDQIIGARVAPTS